MEEWKEIPGYEGLYEASNCGRIRTCEGKVTSNARYTKRVWKQRILKPKFACRKNSALRDLRVSLWKNGNEKTMLVSRAVVLTWCDGYNDGMTVNHIDGNPENNSANNLEWCTRAENIQKGFDTGLYARNQKSVTLIMPNGETMTFASYASASRFLDMNDYYISSLLARGKDITHNGCKVKVG